MNTRTPQPTREEQLEFWVLKFPESLQYVVEEGFTLEEAQEMRKRLAARNLVHQPEEPRPGDEGDVQGDAEIGLWKATESGKKRRLKLSKHLKTHGLKSSK